MKPSVFINLRSQLREYKETCDRFSYDPSGHDLEEIMQYFLTIGSGGTTLTEALLIMEDEIPFDIPALNSISANPNLGKYISYLTKRPKLMKVLNQIISMNFELLDDWMEIYKLKQKRAKLRGDVYSTDEYPAMI